MKNSPLFTRLVQIIHAEKKDITNIYLFATFSGIIQLSLPLGVQAIIGFVLGGSFSTSLVVLISLVLIGIFFAGVFQLEQMKIIEKIQQKLFHKYAFIFKKQIIDMDLKKANNIYLPEKMNRFLDIATLQKGFSKILLDIPLASIQIILGLSIIAIYHPLFLILVILMLFIIIFIFYLTSKKGLETSIKESSYKYETTHWLEEIARSIHFFKLNRIYQLSQIKLDEKIESYLEYRTKHFKILLFQFKNLIFLKIMISATMLIVGTYLLINQQLNIGQFVAAEIIILTIISSVEKIISNLDTFYDMLTSLDKLHAIQKIDIEQGGDYQIDLENNAIEVEFRDVDFSYLDDSKVFTNMNFTINKGEKITITGKDNSGKSSLIRLLSSIYEPTSGNILYNNIPSKNLDINHFRANIGLFLNHKGLIDGTILENITYGNSKNNLNEILQLSNKIGLSEFINKLPKGYDTYVENTGALMPQSVIKKILLARAFINHQSLILLEDPFSQLDDDNIKKIKTFLNEDIKNKTIVVVTNDEDLINSFDRNFHLIDKTLTIHSKK